MLVRTDLAELWDLRDEACAVMVVKHDHRPREKRKFLGRTQSAYPRKNWSSVMLMNCARCETLTPGYVDTAAGLDLHRFRWLEEDNLIGELPPEWNHLVGYDRHVSDPKLVHFTQLYPKRNFTLTHRRLNVSSRHVSVEKASGNTLKLFCANSCKATRNLSYLPSRGEILKNQRRSR